MENFQNYPIYTHKLTSQATLIQYLGVHLTFRNVKLVRIGTVDISTIQYHIGISKMIQYISVFFTILPALVEVGGSANFDLISSSNIS